MYIEHGHWYKFNGRMGVQTFGVNLPEVDAADNPFILEDRIEDYHVKTINFKTCKRKAQDHRGVEREIIQSLQLTAVDSKGEKVDEVIISNEPANTSIEKVSSRNFFMICHLNKKLLVISEEELFF